VNDAIRSLTHNQRLAKIARDFHLAAVLKRCDYWLRGPLVRHAIGGVQFLFTEPDAAEFHAFESYYGKELDFVEALEKRLRRGGVYYDIGSNVGQFLIPVAKIVGERGEVMGFEPHPGNYQRLIRNIALNDLANATVFKLGLSDCSGEIQIFGARGIATIVPPAHQEVFDHRQAQASLRMGSHSDRHVRCVALLLAPSGHGQIRGSQD
jgi:FkbM family methyltransferase